MQYAFAWKGWQGKRHIGCYDLEKFQAGEVSQSHVLRKYPIPGKGLGPLYAYLIILKIRLVSVAPTIVLIKNKNKKQKQKQNKKNRGTKRSSNLNEITKLAGVEAEVQSQVSYLDLDLQNPLFYTAFLSDVTQKHLEMGH